MNPTTDQSATQTNAPKSTATVTKIPKQKHTKKPTPFAVFFDDEDGNVYIRSLRLVPDNVVNAHVIYDLSPRLQGRYGFPLDTKVREDVFNVTGTDQRKLIACMQLKIGWEKLHKNLRVYACTPELLVEACTLVEGVVLKEDKRKQLSQTEELLKQFFYSGPDWEWGRHKISKEELRAAALTLFTITLPDVSAPYLLKLFGLMKQMYPKKAALE